MNVLEEMQNGVRVVLPQGRLDSQTSFGFEKALLKGLDQPEVKLVLDFSQLDYISSAGLRVVLIAAKRVKNAGGKMAICALTDNVRQVFEVSGFVDILTVCEDRSDALAQVS